MLESCGKNGNSVSISGPLTGKTHIRRHQTCKGAKDATHQNARHDGLLTVTHKLSKENSCLIQSLD